jgi:predicted RNA binding protein YcfA (HicA-like mRNA interferase family)
LSNLPTVKSKEFIKIIKKIGFVLHRPQCSHAIYDKKDLKQNTLMSMIQDIGLDKEKFYELLMK